MQPIKLVPCWVRNEGENWIDRWAIEGHKESVLMGISHNMGKEIRPHEWDEIVFTEPIKFKRRTELRANGEAYTPLYPTLLSHLGFKAVGKSQFEGINMNYWAKEGVCLFYNPSTVDEDNYPYLIGYAEMRAGVYYVATIRWIDSEEELCDIYMALTAKELENCDDDD